MRRAKNLPARLDRLHEAMTARRARDGARFSELAENLSRMSKLEFHEFMREVYLTAIQEKEAPLIEHFEKERMQWLLEDNWKEEGVKRYALTPEDIA